MNNSALSKVFSLGLLTSLTLFSACSNSSSDSASVNQMNALNALTRSQTAGLNFIQNLNVVSQKNSNPILLSNLNNPSSAKARYPFNSNYFNSISVTKIAQDSSTASGCDADSDTITLTPDSGVAVDITAQKGQFITVLPNTNYTLEIDRSATCLSPQFNVNLIVLGELFNGTRDPETRSLISRRCSMDGALVSFISNGAVIPLVQSEQSFHYGNGVYSNTKTSGICGTPTDYTGSTIHSDGTVGLSDVAQDVTIFSGAGGPSDPSLRIVFDSTSQFQNGTLTCSDGSVHALTSCQDVVIEYNPQY